MSDFEALDKPSETETNQKYESWYVETIADNRNILLNVCFVARLCDVPNPHEEIYFDTESDAYACMEEYYERHLEQFPYKLEMIRAEIRDGVRTIEEDDDTVESQVMRFE